MATDKALEINKVSSSPMVGPLDLLFWSLRDLFGFSSVSFYVHRNEGLLGTGAQDVHLDFHTSLWTLLFGYSHSDLRQM